jgi:hypothetical protein
MNMTNNDGKPPEEFYERKLQRGQEFTPLFYNLLVNSVGPDLTIPEVSGQHGTGIGKGKLQGSQEHPTLFGQSQLTDNLGPVYATPTFPWKNGHGQGMGTSFPEHGKSQNIGSGQWQQWGSHPWPIAYIPCYMYYPFGYRYNN